MVNDTISFNYGGAMCGTLRVLNVHHDRVFAIENWRPEDSFHRNKAFFVTRIEDILAVFRDTGWDA